MTVKGTCSVTILTNKEIQAVWRYYLLRGSTMSAPAIEDKSVRPPTTGGTEWTAYEPAFSEGTTNSLYFTDCMVFTDGSISYSEVSKSTSYEAAKQAYNKAQSAQDSVDEMPNYIASRGENLVTNGTCLLGNNYNFPQFTYDGSDTYYAGGCFKYIGAGRFESKEYIPVDVNSSYELTYYMKCDKPSAIHYDMLRMYDVDKKEISVYYIMFIEGSLTTLAQDLKPGDTTVYLTDASGFDSSRTETYHKGFIFWNYKNSYGYQYPPETYSRYRYPNLWTTGSTAIDKTNNTITLDKPWTGPTFPAGTSVSQCSDGGTYSFGNGKFYIKTTEWVRKTATWSGVGKNNERHKFREGTAFVRLGWLINYSGAADTINKISTIELTKNADISKVNEVNNKADNAQTTANTAKANAATAQTAASNAQTTANEAKAKAEAAQTAVSTKVETSVFNTLKNTVDENSANITSLTETVTTKADSSTVTTLSNTVNKVKQTADANSSSISNLTTTVNSKADGSKVTALETKTSTIEQNLSGVTTRVTSLESENDGLDTRLTAAESKITDDAIVSTVTSSKTYKDALLGKVDTSVYNTKMEQLDNSISLKATATEVYTKTQADAAFDAKGSASNAKSEAISSAKSYTDTATTDMATKGYVTSQGYLTVTSDAITSKVSKNEVISAINQTAESVSIDASKINLNGAVTFTSFDSSLQTTINNKAETSDLEAVRTIADTAQDNALSAREETDVLEGDLADFKSNEYSQINDKVGELVNYKDDNEKEIANIKSDLSNELVAKKFARIENGSLVLGATNSTTAVLTNEQFGFYTPNSEVPASYFGKDGDVWAFNIERGIVTNDLRFNGFQWISRANRNMSLKWLE